MSSQQVRHDGKSSQDDLRNPPFAATSAEPHRTPVEPAAAPNIATPPRRPFRLLVISSDTYPPQRVDVTVLFGEELARRGHKIDWILQSEAERSRGYVTPWASGQIWVAPADKGQSLFRRVRKHILGIFHDAKVFSLMRSGRYDAVEVRDKFISAVFAALAARLYRKRFVFWLSYPFPEFYLMKARDGSARYPMLYYIRGWAFQVLLYWIVLPAADHIFVQSERMRRDVASHGIPFSKLTPVPMGIRADRFASPLATAQRELIPQDERCVAYLGSLAQERHIDFLLRLFVRVREEMPHAKLYLIGSAEDPEDLQFLLDEATRLGLTDNIIFTGQLPQPQALQYVREADVCVSPLFPTPVFECASPTKLIEYMAMGKAVVVNTHPEQQLLIDASGCGYCVPYDEAAFAEAILKLLRFPDVAREMGERGRRYALEHRSYGVIADLVEREMTRVIAGLDS